MLTSLLPIVQQVVVISDPHIASEVMLNVPGIQKSDIVKVLDLVLSGSGHSSLLTASTNAHWQAVRKAVAPAFSTANIRCTGTDHYRSGLDHSIVVAPFLEASGKPALRCRKAFKQTLIVLDQLIGVFEAAGPDRPIDIDNAAQRESLDVIGRVGKGFRHLGAGLPVAAATPNTSAPSCRIINKNQCLAFAGFDTDFQAVTSMTSKSGANRALDALHGGEIGCRALHAADLQGTAQNNTFSCAYDGCLGSRRAREYGTSHRSFAVHEILQRGEKKI